jgi:hypothetical protein
LEGRLEARKPFIPVLVPSFPSFPSAFLTDTSSGSSSLFCLFHNQRLSILLLTYSTHFASYYPSQRWRNQRISLVKDGMGRVLRMGLGKRKSVFRPREEGTGGLSEEAKREEEVRMDPVGGEFEMRLAFISFFCAVRSLTVASTRVDCVGLQG